jgi:CDP-diacylglycerol--glycerol-3-phosphate 3-phosphatidyltransferase
MPAPRKTAGLFGPALRFALAWPYRAILAGLYRAGVRPWQLTVASLATNVLVGLLLLTGRRLVPGLLLILAGLLDVFDGAVARLRGEDRRAGAFLDSVLDRIGDMILFGCLYWSEGGLGQGLNEALALVTLVTALAVSHVRAEAEAAGVPLTEGLFQRLERYVAMIVGLVIPGTLTAMLAVLAALGTVTLAQRCWSATRGIAHLAPAQR